MPTSGVPLLESLDALSALQKEGKICHLALSNVNAGQLQQGRLSRGTPALTAIAESHGAAAIAKER